MSTAFAKAISGSPGVHVLHEPFTDCYYFGPKRRSSRYGSSAAVSDFDAMAAEELILSAAGPETHTVFFKDLAFQAYHYLHDDLLHRVTSTMMVRHPRRVMASLLRLKPDFNEEELGFQALDTLERRITELQGRPPTIIEGEQFRTNPRQTLLHFCHSNGLIFSEAMLSWGSGSVRPWLPHERDSQQKWHATLESSRSILPPAGSMPSLDLSAQQQAMMERALEIYARLSARAPLTANPVAG